MLVHGHESRTRTQIMDAAQDLILQHGFAGTTVDAILDRVGLTKGAFFHHFPSKAELAHALIDRFATADEERLEALTERGDRLTQDPVQRVLLMVTLLEEEADELTEPSPGCLFASYCYEAQLFDDEIHGIIRGAMLRWREELGERLRAAMEHRPPPVEVDPDDLADLLTVIAEGAFILSRTLKEPKALARQLRQYRTYLELIFYSAGD